MSEGARGGQQMRERAGEANAAAASVYLLLCSVVVVDHETQAVRAGSSERGQQ